MQAIKLKHDSKKQRDLTASIQRVCQNGLLDFLTNLQDESLVIVVLARARRRAQLTILSLSGNTSSNCKMCSTFPCFTPTIRGEKYYFSRYRRHITLEFVLNKNKNKNKREKTNKKPPPPPTLPNQSNKKHSWGHTLPVLLSVGCTWTQFNQEKCSGMRFGVRSLARRTSIMIRNDNFTL